MHGLRKLLEDRVSAGVATGLSSYFLILHIFVAALTCGMTVPAVAAPQFVLCQPMEPVADAVQKEGKHAFSHPCPCVICHGLDLAIACAFAPGADLGPAFSLREVGVIALLHDRQMPIDPSRLGLAPVPRGPPSFST